MGERRHITTQPLEGEDGWTDCSISKELLSKDIDKPLH
jgi:hypothetical protein